MKSRNELLAAVLLTGGAMLGAGLTANAADDPAATSAPAPAGHEPHAWGPMRIYGKLGLTAEQQSSIKSIMVAAKPQMQTLHQQMKANHLKLMQTQPDDPNYANVVAEVAQSTATLASQRTSQTAEVRAQIYALLTPAQKSQLIALEAAWVANPHHGDWAGRHAGPAS